MAVTIRIQAAAAREIAQEAAFYRRESGASLAEKWRTAVNTSIASIRAFPLLGSPVLARDQRLTELRRLAITGFPKLHIFYRVESASILSVVAVVHDARHPDVIFGKEASG